MIDEFDYKEPACPLCDGKDFYYPDKNAPIGRIPTERIIARVDEAFDRGDSDEAGRILEHWKKEARALKDLDGELAICSELCGYYRKASKSTEGLICIDRTLKLFDELGQGNSPAGATILINAATALKSFGNPKDSLPLYRKAEQIYAQFLEPTDPRFGGLYNNMALALVDLEMFDEAKKAYSSAIDIMKKNKSLLEVAISLINLAHLHEKLDDDSEVDPCIKQAYALLIDEGLKHDGYYAFVCDKCAPSFRHFGYIKHYEEIKRRADKHYART